MRGGGRRAAGTVLALAMSLLLANGVVLARMAHGQPAAAPGAARSGQDAVLTAPDRPAAVPSTVATAAGSGFVADPDHSWAVLIGVQHYDAPTHPTIAALGDVAIFQHLLDQAGWQDSHILVLTDKTATAAAIRWAMRWLAGHSGPSTFSVFHYSGHVLQTGGHEFLWGVDNTFVRNDEFGAAMHAVQGRAWVDVAGCESAGFDQGVDTPLRLFTSSSMTNQKSYEDPVLGESVWTWLTVDAGMLYHANSPAGTPISIQQAVRASQPAAASYTANQQPYGAQQPFTAGGNGDWYVGPGLAPAHVATGTLRAG